MRTWRLQLRLFDGRIQTLLGTEDTLRVVREVLVELMEQNSEAIISHMEEGRPILVVVPELDEIGEVENVPEPDGEVTSS